MSYIGSIVERLLQFVEQDSGDFDPIRRAEIEYGLTILFLNTFETLVILFIAWILGLFKHSLLCFVCFGGVRVFAGGVHAKKPSACFLSALAIYIGVPYMSKYLVLSSEWVCLLGFASLLLLAKYAPADNLNKSIVSRRQAKKLKLGAVMLALVLFLMTLLQLDVISKSVVSLGIFLESLTIAPFMYRLTNTKGGWAYEETT